MSPASVTHTQLSPASPGVLVGLKPGSAQLTLLGSVELGQDAAFSQQHPALLHLLPHGLEFVGAAGRSEQAAQECAKAPAVSKLLQASQQAAVLAFSGPQEGSLACKKLQGGAELPTTAASSAAEAGPLGWAVGSELVLVRCHASLQLQAYSEEAAPSSSSSSSSKQLSPGMQKAVARGLAALQAQLESPGLGFVVACKDGSHRLLSSSTSGTVSDLAPSVPAGTSPLAAAPVTAQPVLPGPLSPAALSSTSSAAAPAFEYQPASAAGPQGSGVAAAGTGTGAGPAPVHCHSATLHLDVLAYIPKSTPLASLGPSVLRPALVRQLQAVGGVIAKFGTIADVGAHHFLPHGRSHHVTLLYPRLGKSEDACETALESYRRELHQLLGLAPNRPALRLANALHFSADGSTGAGADGQAASRRLKDVHHGLNVPVPGSTTYLLDGSYEYCHYMQDKFNDNGWGCAYRSLQTIVSWFRLQQYTSKPIPSHREIQELLVKLGDKPQSFVGSSNWIGAIELSYILDEYLGVTSKILTVNKGSEIPNHARQLANHFSTQGTPVMIGGGVLAYTLLGVAFNELTGDCAFLILDPHYTGGEDLKRIQQGTWVWWKKPGDSAAAGGPLFVQDAFYNFLCPQRPSMV